MTHDSVGTSRTGTLSHRSSSLRSRPQRAGESRHHPLRPDRAVGTRAHSSQLGVQRFVQPGTRFRRISVVPSIFDHMCKQVQLGLESNPCSFSNFKIPKQPDKTPCASPRQISNPPTSLSGNSLIAIRLQQQDQALVAAQKRNVAPDNKHTSSGCRFPPLSHAVDAAEEFQAFRL